MNYPKTLAEKYAEHSANTMDLGELVQYVTDDIQHRCEQMSHEDLMAEIEQLAPELLKAQNDQT